MKRQGAVNKTIYCEYESVRKRNRPELAKLLDIVQPSDTIIATEVSRITGSTKQLCDIIEFAKEKYIKLALGSFIVEDPIILTVVKPEHTTLERQGCPLNERRMYERYPFRGKALLHLKVGDEILRIRYPCEIIDISEGGVRFNVRFKLAVCDTFIFIQTKPDGSLSMLCGEVVWRQIYNEDMYQYGARLFDEDGSLSKELKEQVEQLKKSYALP